MKEAEINPEVATRIVALALEWRARKQRLRGELKAALAAHDDGRAIRWARVLCGLDVEPVEFGGTAA